MSTPSPNPPKTVKTRILAISDTHAGNPDPFTPGPLPHADILIHAGDLTLIGTLEEHQAAIAQLRTADAELKLVVPGNHDLTLDKAYAAREDHHTCGEADLYDEEKVRHIRALYEGDEAGVVYMEEGTRTFELRNGAKFTVYASAHTPEFCGWAFAYERDEDRFNDSSNSSSNAKNPMPAHPAIDIATTHGPPHGILDEVAEDGPVGCAHLRRAVEAARPRLHVFGHIHEGWGARRVKWGGKGAEVEEEEVDVRQEDGNVVLNVSRDGREVEFERETLFLNASIMTLDMEPTNKPWIIDLELPCA